MTNEKLISEFANGIEEQSYTTVIAAGKRFVLFRISGHSAWASVGQRAYVPVRYVLIRKHQWWMGRGTEKREWEGKVAPFILINAFQDAERTGKLEAA